ncbi:FAD-dependent oxidoreductase [Mariprofundus erugo]|uniref:FAD-dependent oxidoreductase n=1 Tax=Mariprofundus erugo TaxID=2528639 RepID=A0A5R9GV16_9PROT|nr:FAD-dependent oxidoreductase [Mariprofundus erugo]TLS68143.1 FAD-dependent oxidoreductase [Mariprofundus erugo]
MNDQYDMIVIGAGISGLAMAYKAQEAGMRVLVLEKEGRAGGCFHTEVVPADTQPFWLEMGTHTCFNSYGRLIELLNKLGMMEQLVARTKLPYRMLDGNHLVTIPSRLHLFELISHAWRLFSIDKQGKSVAEYYGAITGPKNYRETFRHAFNAVICQQADDVPADMLFRKRPRNKSVMRSYTFPQGLGAIITALEESLSIKKGQQIQSIERTDSGFLIDTEEASLNTTQLVCATPVLAAARLLKNTAPAIAEQLNWVAEVEVESVAVVIEKGLLSCEPLAGIIAADGDFYSAVARDIVDHPRLRGLTFHFKPGLLNDEEKTARICSLLNIQPSSLLYIFHKTNRLPAPDRGHHQLIAHLDEMLAPEPLALVGNYFAGVAIEDCLERVESEFIRLQTR